MAKIIRPVTPLRLSWRISQIKNATSGNKKTVKKIMEGALMFLKSPESSKTESPESAAKIEI